MWLSPDLCERAPQPEHHQIVLLYNILIRPGVNCLGWNRAQSRGGLPVCCSLLALVLIQYNIVGLYPIHSTLLMINQLKIIDNVKLTVSNKTVRFKKIPRQELNARSACLLVRDICFSWKYVEITYIAYVFFNIRWFILTRYSIQRSMNSTQYDNSFFTS